MNKKNILKYATPVIAVVVLLESLLLISNLKKKAVLIQEPVVPVEQGGLNDNQMAEKLSNFEIAIEGEPEMKMSEMTEMEVKATAMSTKSLDSVNLYLKYNPAAFDISNLVFDDRLPVPTFNKVSTTKGMVVVNFLISDPGGVKVMQGEVLSLAKFQVKPKMTGDFDFEISTGNEVKESATMFVESESSEILPFTSNKLTVNVVR